MTKLTDAQIARFAAAGGFAGGGLVMAIAIALAESGGDTAAQGFNRSGTTITSVDRGLWQINSRFHPEVSDNCAYDATCAAGAAFRISGHGMNWSPWSTYTNGAYKQYLTRAQAAAKGGGSSGGQLAPPPAPGSTGTPAQHTMTLSELLAPPADAPVTTQEMGSMSEDIFSAYRLIVALIVMFGFLYVLSKTRAGYVAIYYGEVLILFFLFATQSQFFKEALLPLAPQHAETPAGPGTRGQVQGNPL